MSRRGVPAALIRGRAPSAEEDARRQERARSKAEQYGNGPITILVGRYSDWTPSAEVEQRVRDDDQRCAEINAFIAENKLVGVSARANYTTDAPVVIVCVPGSDDAVARLKAEYDLDVQAFVKRRTSDRVRLAPLPE